MWIDLEPVVMNHDHAEPECRGRKLGYETPALPDSYRKKHEGFRVASMDASMP